MTSGVARITRRASTDGGKTYPSVTTDGAPSGADGYTFNVEPGAEWNRFSFYVTWTVVENGDVTYSNIRLYTGTDAEGFEPYEDIPSLALDNAQGQKQSVAVEAGCRARQETRKNLLKPPGDATVGGVTYTFQDDGTYLANGTVTDMSLLSLYKGVLPPGQYTISGGAGGIQVSLAVYKADGTYIRTICASNRGSTQTGTVTGLTGEEAYHQAFIQAVNSVVGQTVTNVVLSPQLERGDTATAFEPYKSILPITGRESVEIAACGKNLLPINTWSNTSQGITTTSNEDGTYTVNGTATGVNAYDIDSHFSYLIPGETYTLSGGKNGVKLLLTVNNADGYVRNHAISSNGNAATFVAEDLADGEYNRIVIQCDSGTTVDNVTIYPQLEAGDTATAFESYIDLGGGTVTPTEPLYGLPGAEDTLEISTDGDVTVTRRTAVLELDGTENWVRSSKNNHGYYYRLSVANIFQITTTSILPNLICSHYRTESSGKQWGGTDNCISQNPNENMRTEILIYDANYAESDLATWKSYLAAQVAAGTPVTIVYELAAPETEALTAISPIAPQPGQLNLFTNADALTATIYGSGWETVNDTSSIQDALANLDGDLASLINEVGLLNGEVGSIAQQIISPDGIKNIVFESSEYQAMANTVEQNANELSVTQTTVTDINGRVETIEGTVRISGSNIDIGRSDSNVQLHLDNTGWSISEGGQETIYARQNRVVAPRFQTTSLIFGALAFNSSGGHFRLMKYGG